MAEVQETTDAWVEYAGARVPIVSSCSIGRGPTNAIVLQGTRVSRRHAIIHLQDHHEYWLVDLGSCNGTYCNGKRVIQPTRLRNGDRIAIGETVLLFRAAGSREATITNSVEATAIELRGARRWLLLADVVGSTQLSRKLSPNELSMLMGQWLAESKSIIESNHGAINKFLGDGFFAYWPDEASPETIAKTLRELRTRQKKCDPDFRVVVHYGEMVMGGPSLGEESLLGVAVTKIFRMEKLAGYTSEPRLMSAEAFKLLSPYIPTGEMGEHQLAGFDEKESFYSFLGDSRIEGSDQ